MNNSCCCINIWHPDQNSDDLVNKSGCYSWREPHILTPVELSKYTPFPLVSSYINKGHLRFEMYYNLPHLGKYKIWLRYAHIERCIDGQIYNINGSSKSKCYPHHHTTDDWSNKYDSGGLYMTCKQGDKIITNTLNEKLLMSGRTKILDIPLCLVNVATNRDKHLTINISTDKIAPCRADETYGQTRAHFMFIYATNYDGPDYKIDTCKELIKLHVEKDYKCLAAIN